MPEVFADTGYWIALYFPDDQWQQRVREATERLGGCRIVTSDLVLVEFLNYCSRQGASIRERAAAVVKAMLSSDSGVEVVLLTTSRLEAAVQRYADRLDQRWSLVDCHSFLIMEERGITEALAYDRDFEQPGLRALLRED